MIRSVAFLAITSNFASIAVAQSLEPNAIGEMPLGLEDMAIQDLLVPQVSIDTPFYQTVPESSEDGTDIPTVLQRFNEDELYELVRDPALVGDAALLDGIETLSDTPLTSALAEAARGNYNPTQDEYQQLRESVDPNGPQSQISDFMALSALRMGEGTFAFSFDPNSNLITQEFTMGESLVIPVDQAPLNVIVEATRTDPNQQGRQFYELYRSAPTRREQALSYLSTPELPDAIGVAALESAFDQGDSEFLRELLTEDLDLLSGDSVGLDLLELQALAQNSAQTPEMQIFLGDIFLQQGEPAAALQAFSTVAPNSSQAEQAFGRQALASLIDPENIEAIERELAQQVLLENLLSGDNYASAIVLADRDRFTPAITLAAAGTVLASPASPEQLTSARQAQIEACDADEGASVALCSIFDIVYVTTRRANPDDSEILFGVDQGPLASGIIRTRLPIAFDLAMAQEPSLSALRCQLGRIACSRALEQLVNEADTPDFPANTTPQRVNDLEQTITDALNHFPVSPDASPRALVFIHGFNTDFAEATEAVARLMITARYPSTPYLFSWPSQGKVLFSRQRSMTAVGNERTSIAYQLDRDAVESSCNDMRQALLEVIRRYGAGQVDVVAHSMGNQLLWEMIDGCGDPASTALDYDSDKPFRSMILVAADLSLLKFRNAQKSYADLAEELIIYASPNDVVLQASARVFNQNTLGDRYDTRVPRLGLYAQSTHALDSSFQVISTQTVDGTTTYAPRNHSYHINNPTIRRDIAMILNGQFSHPAIRCLRGPIQEGHYIVSPNCL